MEAILRYEVLEYATMTYLANQGRVTSHSFGVVLCQCFSFLVLANFPLFVMEGLRLPTSYSNVIVLFRPWCYVTFVVCAAQPLRAASGNLRGSQAAI